MKTIIPSSLAALLHPFLPKDAYLSADQPTSDSPAHIQRLASVSEFATGIAIAVILTMSIAAEVLFCGAGVYYVVTEILTIPSRPAQIVLSLIAGAPLALLIIGLNWGMLIRHEDNRSTIPDILCGFGLAGFVLDGLIFTLLLSITISG